MNPLYYRITKGYRTITYNDGKIMCQVVMPEKRYQEFMKQRQAIS